MTDTSVVTGQSVQVLDVTIGRGDGSVASQTLLHGSVTHTYAVAGTYTVSDAVRFLVCQGIECLPQVTIATATVETGGSGGASASVTASFAFSVTGMTVNVGDTSNVTGDPTVTGVSFAFGDGSMANGTSLRFTAAHTYARAGTYNVTETVAWTYGGKAFASTSSVDVNVGTSASTRFALSSWGAALLFGSSALLVTQGIPQTRIPPISAGVGALAAVLGYAVAFLLGGALL